MVNEESKARKLINKARLLLLEGLTLQGTEAIKYPVRLSARSLMPYLNILTKEAELKSSWAYKDKILFIVILLNLAFSVNSPEATKLISWGRKILSYNPEGKENG